MPSSNTPDKDADDDCPPLLAAPNEAKSSTVTTTTTTEDDSQRQEPTIIECTTPIQKKKRRQHRHYLFLTSLVTTFLYGGAYYGWGPMQLLLENAGSYASKCVQGEEEPCQEQTQALVNIRFISQMALLASPVFGEVADRYGAAYVAHLQGVFMVIGSLFMVISLKVAASNMTSSTNLDWLLHISFWLFSLSAWANGNLIVETGLVFRGKARGRVISAMSSTYDSASVTYLGLWALTQVGRSGGLEEWIVMALYLGGAVLTFAVLSYLWCTVVPAEEENGMTLGNKPGDAIGQTTTTTGDDSGLWPSELLRVSLGKRSGGGLSVVNEDGGGGGDEEEYNDNITSRVDQASTDKKESTTRSSILSESSDHDNFSEQMTLAAIKADLKLSSMNLMAGINEPTTSGKNLNVESAIQENEEQDENMQAKNQASNSKTIEAKNQASNSKTTVPDDYILIADRTPMEQLKSEPFVMLAAFFTIQLTANVWALTTARDFLAYLGDDEFGNRYLSIFTLLGPASLAAIPCVDRALNKYGFHVALQTVNLLAIGYTVIKVASDNLNVQIVGFVLFSFYRSFLFSVSMTALPNIVSRNMVGRSIGVFNITSGLVGFLNIPLANVALNRLEGNFFIPNLFFCALNLPCIFLVWRVGQGLERERLFKETQSMDTHLEDYTEALQRAQPARLSTFARDSIVTGGTTRRGRGGGTPTVQRTRSLKGVPSERRLTNQPSAHVLLPKMNRSSV